MNRKWKRKVDLPDEALRYQRLRTVLDGEEHGIEPDLCVYAVI